MSSMKGYSPAQHVLGATALSPGDILGEDFHLAEQSAFTAGDPETHMLSLSRRVSTSKAFVEANASAKVRRALLARSRPLRRAYEVGEWILAPRGERRRRDHHPRQGPLAWPSSRGRPGEAHHRRRPRCSRYQGCLDRTWQLPDGIILEHLRPEYT